MAEAPRRFAADTGIGLEARSGRLFKGSVRWLYGPVPAALPRDAARAGGVVVIDVSASPYASRPSSSPSSRCCRPDDPASGVQVDARRGDCHTMMSPVGWVPALIWSTTSSLARSTTATALAPLT